MLWFLLTAVAYATALAGVVGAVGFVAVQRYALLQRLLAAGVDRVLGRLVDPEGGHSVTHTDAGGRRPAAGSAAPAPRPPAAPLQLLLMVVRLCRTCFLSRLCAEASCARCGCCLSSGHPPPLPPLANSSGRGSATIPSPPTPVPFFCCRRARHRPAHTRIGAAADRVLWQPRHGSIGGPGGAGVPQPLPPPDAPPGGHQPGCPASQAAQGEAVVWAEKVALLLMWFPAG